MSGQQQQRLTAAQVSSLILRGGAIPGGGIVPPAVIVTQPTQPVVTIANPASASTIVNIVPRGVGLIRKIYVQASLTFTVPNGVTLTRAPFGVANMFSNITMTDLNNIVRHNMTGKFLTNLQSTRQRAPFGAAVSSDTPLGFGSNYDPGIVSPASISGTGAAVTVEMLYEVPIMYQNQDFRGAIYLGTTQASMNVAMTLNPALFVASGSDTSDAIYSYAGGSPPTLTNLSVTTFSEYYDQLPQGADGAPLLPLSAMQQAYSLISTTQNGMVANSDYSINIPNARTVISNMFEYDNGGALNAGTDINYWKLVGANSYIYGQWNPKLLSYIRRRDMMTDMPAGVYFFDNRNAPIQTTTYGNTNFILNASSAASNAVLKWGCEYFQNSTTYAGGASFQSA